MEWKNLIPKKTTPIDGIIYSNPTIAEIDSIFDDLDKDELLFIDYETNGLNYVGEGFLVAGVAMSSLTLAGGLYINFSSDDIRLHVLNRMKEFNLSCFNLTFDAGVRERMTRDLMDDTTLWDQFNYDCDVRGLVYQLDQKTGFGFGLKELMKTLLLWTDTNELELDNWLLDNGYNIGTKNEPKPDKSMMYKAPVSILGRYACLDAQATKDLYYEIVIPALEQWPDVYPYHQTATITLYKLIIEQRFKGMTVNVERLTEWKEYLERRRDAAAELFTYHSEATPYLEEVLKERIDRTFFKNHPTGDYSGKKENKDGSIYYHYKNWLEKKKTRYDGLWDHLNLNSRDQVRIALYDKWLGTENWHVEPLTNSFGQRSQWKNSKKEWGWELHVKGEVIDFWSSAEAAEGKIANPPTNKYTTHLFGNAGKYYLAYTRAVKELGYVNAMLHSSPNGVHPLQLRPHGTLSDRCSGSSNHGKDPLTGKDLKVNIQQIPKSAGYLRNLIVEEDEVILQADFTALEPVVTSELSKCPAHRAIYADPDNPNDAYIFLLANISAFKEEVRSLGYDPYNHTQESLKVTKKKFKRLRGDIGKPTKLGMDYGAGVSTLHKSLNKGSTEISFDQAKQIHKEYWEIFGAVKKYEEALKEECSAGNGVYSDGLGHPITIRIGHKDTFNRCIQRTGHSILCKHLYHVDRLRIERGVKMIPYICNFHDEYFFRVKKSDIEEAKRIALDAVDMTNEWLGGDLKHRCDPETLSSIAESKVEINGDMYSEEEHGTIFEDLTKLSLDEIIKQLKEED